MKKIIFITGVSGVGKTSIYENIKNSELKNTFSIYDIDNLLNINDYEEDNYNLFYKEAINKAINMSNDKDIVLFSCINHNDVEDLKLDDCTTRIVLIVCENEELKKRLKNRNNECSDDSFIKNQINYQNWFISNLDCYDANYDNTNNMDEVVDKIVDFIEIFE